MKQSRRAADPEWKQLLRIAQELEMQDTPEAQCRLLAEKGGLILSAHVQVFLSKPSYPIWRTAEAEFFLSPESPALVNKAYQQGGLIQGDKPEGTRFSKCLAILLISKDVKIGVMQIEREEVPFNDRDIQMAEALAFHASIGMQTKRLEVLKNWYLDQLNLIRSVASQIAVLPRQKDLYNRVAKLIQDTFKFNHVAIYTPDEYEEVKKSRGDAVRNSEAVLPLKVENRILGVLDIQCAYEDAFQENDMLVLQTLVDHIALAMESKHLTQGLDRSTEQVSSVFEISHAITSILDLDQLLSSVVALIQNRFNYPFVHAYTVHSGRRLVIYQTGIGERSEAIKTQGLIYPLDAPQGIISWVARNGKTFLSNEVTNEPLYLPSDLPPYDTRSELVVPLIHGNEVLGVLDIQSRLANAFDENDVSMFDALAAPIAVAMRNAALYRSEQWRRRVAESFRDVAHLISANQPLNQLLNVILEKLEGNLPCDASAIWLLEDEIDATEPPGSRRLKLAATHNIQPEKIILAPEDRVVQEMLEKSLDQDQPLIRRPGDPFDPLGAALEFNPNYSSITAPMRTNDRPLGVITLAHNQDGRYGSEAQAITATFASYAAIAIQNARLYTESQEQALISTMLLQVSEASQTIMTIDDLLTTMVRLTRLLVGIRKCAFLIWEDALQSFELKSWYGFEPDDEKTRRYSPQLPGLALLASKRTTLYVDDPANDLDLPEIELPSGTIVMQPLMVRGTLIGAFLVGLQMSRTPDIESGFDPKALAILQGIAHQTSMTIDNLRLIEARQEEAYVTAALLQVAQAVASSTDLNDTLDTIVHLLPILVGINTCIIYLWDSSNQLFRPTQVYGQNRREEEQIISRPFAPGEYPLLDVIRQKGEMYLSQIHESGLPFSAWPELPCLLLDQIDPQTNQPGGEWIIGYPLSLQDQVFGVLLAREVNATMTFWERRLEILNGIAQHVSLAIQNDLYKQELVQTERIEREIQLARQIQETFLPDLLPQLNKWELDLRWETAREVGGDFYDFFKLSDNRIGLVIADVSDKGIPAALYMTVARTLIRSNAFGGQSPGEVLKEVNKLLLNDSDDAMFITVIYAIIALETGEMTYANAGHNRPLLYRSRTKILEQLPKGGTALGVLDDLQIENHDLEIQPGDCLILFTDGVTDLLSPDNSFFGDFRLRNIIQEHGDKPAHDMLELLDDALIEFRRGLPPMDDITLLAIRRQPAQRSGGKKRKKNAASVAALNGTQTKDLEA